MLRCGLNHRPAIRMKSRSTLPRRPAIPIAAPWHRAYRQHQMISSRRPLSPHLQVYRWQITMTLSILHRLTGIALAVGTLLLTYWLAAAATGPDAFAAAQGFIGSLVGRLLRSEEHTSELQSLMRISYAVFCLKTKTP